jgi:hypothetical protein
MVVFIWILITNNYFDSFQTTTSWETGDFSDQPMGFGGLKILGWPSSPSHNMSQPMAQTKTAIRMAIPIAIVIVMG